MSTNVTMPSMGFDMTEGKVSRWLKNIGDAVTRNETIGEIETEKATVDLTAPVDDSLEPITPPETTDSEPEPEPALEVEPESLPASEPEPVPSETETEAAP